jgi:hypothetical protein
MGTTLTGTTPQDTYDSLIKVTDNGPISGTLKALSDGLGNDSTLSLSTTAASIAGTLAVTGALSGSTATFSGQGQFNAISSGAYLLLNAPTNGGTITMQADGVSFADIGSELGNFGTGSATNLCVSARATKDLILGGGALKTMTLTSAGNVGIGTSAPNVSGYSRALTISSANSAIELTSATNVVQATIASSAQGLAVEGIGTTGIRFFTSTSGATTERVRITAGGVLELAQGQIKFPATQVASADVNTLDDYEEGTFTPTFDPASGAYDTLTYGTTNGKYTKIGNRVDFSLRVTITAYSAGSASGLLRLGNLPFTCVTSFVGSVSMSLVDDFAADRYPIKGFVNDTTNYILLRYMTALNTNEGYVSATDITASSTIRVSGTYFTA